MNPLQSVHHFPDSNWLNKELFGINFWDKRLNKRFLKVANNIARNPNGVLKQVIEDSNNLKAAYRLFDNPKIKPELILEPHILATKQRISEHDVVLVIMDTTDVAFPGNSERKGMGPLGNFNASVQGFQMHSAYAVSTSGQPLGFLSVRNLVRERKENTNTRKASAKSRESYKWIGGLKEILRNIPKETKCIIMGDRESDFYDFLNEARKHKSDFNIRARWNRKLNDKELKLFDYLNELPVKYEKTFKIARKNVKTKYVDIVDTTVRVTYDKVEISPPEMPTTPDSSEHEPIVCWAIQVKEIEPREEYEELEWVLLTNQEVKNNEEAEEKIEWYKHRPKIEEFHKILKSGCNVEECQLETKERVERLLAVLVIIAWRIGWLTAASRTMPEESCELVLTEAEWKALYCMRNKTKKRSKRTLHNQRSCNNDS